MVDDINNIDSKNLILESEKIRKKEQDKLLETDNNRNNDIIPPIFGKEKDKNSGKFEKKLSNENKEITIPEIIYSRYSHKSLLSKPNLVYNTNKLNINNIIEDVMILNNNKDSNLNLKYSSNRSSSYSRKSLKNINKNILNESMSKVLMSNDNSINNNEKLQVNNSRLILKKKNCNESESMTSSQFNISNVKTLNSQISSKSYSKVSKKKSNKNLKSSPRELKKLELIVRFKFLIIF